MLENTPWSDELGKKFAESLQKESLSEDTEELKKIEEAGYACALILKAFMRGFRRDETQNKIDND